MTHITREEVIHIARISNILITEEEIPGLIKQLGDVLSYAARVKEVAEQSFLGGSLSKNTNVFREDVVVATNTAPILAQAPEREGAFFVVPAVLDK